MAKPSKTALFTAAKSWDAPTVAAIVNAAPELVRGVDPRGRTALHVACAVKAGGAGLRESDGTKTVATLLKAGADINAPAFTDGIWRAEPVWYAVAHGENLPLVKYLLKRGADPTWSSWAAVWRDDAAMLRALLAAGPRLDLIVEGETPIFYAARLKRLKTLDLLVKAGADPTIKDAKGRTVLEIARARKLPKQVMARLEELTAARR